MIEFIAVDNKPYQLIASYVADGNLSMNIAKSMGIDGSGVSRISRTHYIRECVRNGEPHYAVHNPNPVRKHDASTLYYKVKQ